MSALTGFDADFALTSATCSGGQLSFMRPEPIVKCAVIATACSARETPIAMPIVDTRRAGASASGGMRAGGSAPATARWALRGAAAMGATRRWGVAATRSPDPDVATAARSPEPGDAADPPVPGTAVNLG